MASIGHIAVGLAAARIHCPKGVPRNTLFKAMAALSALSLAPDADVIGFLFGVAYSSQLGHRGATHSITAAVACGLVAWLASRRLGTALTVGAVVLSHPLLDMLTDGGLGCAIFWPFSAERFFFPVHPIPVAPIGLGMLSLRGVTVVTVESLIFLPLFIFAAFPRKPSTPRAP